MQFTVMNTRVRVGFYSENTTSNMCAKRSLIQHLLVRCHMTSYVKAVRRNKRANKSIVSKLYHYSGVSRDIVSTYFLAFSSSP